jgi:6-phosphogluconate dehydrogenase (decarboxylating)
MQIGMIGLGRMGANMVRRLLEGSHECVVFDRVPAAVDELAREKAVGASSLADLGSPRNSRSGRSTTSIAGRAVASWAWNAATAS